MTNLTWRKPTKIKHSLGPHNNKKHQERRLWKHLMQHLRNLVVARQLQVSHRLAKIWIRGEQQLSNSRKLKNRKNPIKNKWWKPLKKSLTSSLNSDTLTCPLYYSNLKVLTHFRNQCFYNLILDVTVGCKHEIEHRDTYNHELPWVSLG